MDKIIVGKIERISGNRADIEPLFLDDDGNTFPLITDAVITRYSSSVPPYQRGDIVTVGILDRDFSDALLGRKGNGGTQQKHDISNATVLGWFG